MVLPKQHQISNKYNPNNNIYYQLHGYKFQLSNVEAVCQVLETAEAGGVSENDNLKVFWLTGCFFFKTHKCTP